MIFARDDAALKCAGNFKINFSYAILRSIVPGCEVSAELFTILVSPSFASRRRKFSSPDILLPLI